MVRHLVNPGRCPGLLYSAPSGLGHAGRIVGQPRTSRPSHPTDGRSQLLRLVLRWTENASHTTTTTIDPPAPRKHMASNVRPTQSIPRRSLDATLACVMLRSLCRVWCTGSESHRGLAALVQRSADRRQAFWDRSHEPPHPAADHGWVVL